MKNKKYTDIENFENVPWCFMLEGNGRGTKLLQSYLDGSKNSAMIPGYASNYFFPFLRKYKKKNDKELIKLFFYHFESIFDSKKNPGSESLHKLGPNKNENITINKNDFKRNFFNYLRITKKDIDNTTYFRFKAIHFAYFKCTKTNIRKLKIILSHVHAYYQYKKYVKIYFPSAKIIGFSSNPQVNFSRRIKNSILRPNYEKLYYTDFVKSLTSAFYVTCSFFFDGLLDLKELKKNQLLIVYFEDLKLNKKKILKRVCSFLDIKFSHKINMQETFGGKIWNYSYYNEDLKSKKIQKFNQIINYPSTLNNYEKVIFDYIFFNINNKKFNIIKKSVMNSFLIYLYILLPMQIEIKNLTIFYSKKNIITYIKNAFKEFNNISKIKNKYFSKNLFYTEKWNIKYLFLKFFLINSGVLTNNKWIYLITKLIFLLYAPLVFLFYYFLRVFFFIKIITNSVLQKNKIDLKLFT